jgi:glycosyltransferase involved in cell wall biosynthesis
VVGTRRGHLWEQLDLPQYLRAQGSPLLLNLGNTAPLLYRNKLATLHDIAFERFPQNFSLAFRLAYQLATPRIIKSARKVLTVSHFSKSEICAVYGTPADKVVVIPNAVSAAFQPQSATPNTERYLLAVSSLNQQKNFHGLIDAFSLLNQDTHKLYIVGTLNSNFADPGLLYKIESNPRITLLGRVSDSQLIELYSGADAFVYPSFYEGFGLPPLEAQACGCPVLVANSASLPEVCADAALYCSPHSPEDIAAQMSRLINEPELGRALRAKGYANTQRYSWNNSATHLLQVIQELT